MRRTMMTMSDQQYNALVASRSGGGPSGVSSQLLPPSQGAQYLSQKLYANRVDPYHAAAVGSGLGGSATPYPPPVNRAAGDDYPDPKEMRTHLAAERRGGGLLPSPTLVDYSPPAFVDHVGTRGVLPAPTVSPEVVGAYHRGAPTLSNAELLAARARRSELAASYPSGYGSDVPVRRIAPASSYDNPGLLPGPAAGILGPGGVRRGRELDRYLLSVQPEKLVRYASSILDPALRRNGYQTVDNDLNPDEDVYSNYRRAKARRMGLPEFGGRDEPGSRRDRDEEVFRDAEQYRERKGRESGRELGKRSSDRRHTNGSFSKGNDANRVDRHNNASQSSGGRRGQQNGGQNGGQNKRSRDSEKPEKLEKLEKGAGAKGKVEDPNSDKDSELGSLCADLSDSDEDKVEKKSEEAATVIDGPLAGMIFGCSSATFHECMRLQLFGLPAKSKEDVLRVTPGTKVFLFNFDTKELSGIFEAVSHGGWQIQPDAFRDFGGFPAQVQVCCSEQCQNIPQSMFKAAIKDNYVSSTRFRFDLNTKQVRELVRMFRQTAGHLPRQMQDRMADRYLSARAPPEEYIARGGGPQQQRPYSRHPQARFGTSRVVPYDDARVMMISMSANKTTNFRKRSKRRASKRAPLKKGRKKRKVSTTTTKPDSPPPPPLADNCSLYSLSGEMIEGADDLGDDDDTSNPDSGVIVLRDGIATGSPRNVGHRPKEIVETPPAAKGIAPSSGLSPSKPPVEFPQPQSDLGKQEVSFLEDDSYNDGNFGLAGSRADEQGQGLGHDVPLQGALSSGNVIKSSDCTLSSMGEGLGSEVHGDFSTAGPAEAPMNLGGNNTPSKTDCDCQLSELDDENRSREGLGDIGVPSFEESHTFESISSDFGTGGKLPDVHIDGVFIETVEEEADCTLLSVGKDEELEAIAADDAVGPEAPFLREEMMVAADVAIWPEDPCIREEVMVGAEVSICPEGPYIREDVMVATEFAADFEDSLVTEEVVTASSFVCKDEDLGVIAPEVATDSEASCGVGAMMVATGFARKNELELTAIDSEAPIVIEEAKIASAIVGKDDEELGVIAAEVAIDSEAPCVRGELMIAAEVAVDSETACVRKEVMISTGAAGKDDVEVIATEVAIDSEAAVDAGAPFVREEVMIASEIVGQDNEVEIIAHEVAVDSDAPFDREEEIINAETVGNEETLGVIAGEAPCGLEEVMIAAQTLRSQLLASADMDDIVMTVHDEGDQGEEVAQTLRSQLLASTDMDDIVTTVHDAGDQGEEVVHAADAVDREQPPSPDLNVVNGDDEYETEGLPADIAVDFQLATSPDEDEEEKEGLPADNAVDFELASSPDEDGDDGGEDQQDYDYGDGDGEDEDEEDEDEEEEEEEEEETVDVSVDGELSNGGEDGDEDEEIGVDDDPS